MVLADVGQRPHAVRVALERTDLPAVLPVEQPHVGAAPGTADHAAHTDRERVHRAVDDAAA